MATNYPVTGREQMEGFIRNLERATDTPQAQLQSNDGWLRDYINRLLSSGGNATIKCVASDYWKHFTMQCSDIEAAQLLHRLVTGSAASGAAAESPQRKLDSSEMRACIQHFKDAYPHARADFPSHTSANSWNAIWQVARLPGRITSESHGWQFDELERTSDHHQLEAFIKQGFQRR